VFKKRVNIALKTSYTVLVGSVYLDFNRQLHSDYLFAVARFSCLKLMILASQLEDQSTNDTNSIEESSLFLLFTFSPLSGSFGIDGLKEPRIYRVEFC